MASHLLVIAASLLSTCNIVHGLRTGAPTFGGVCDNLRQQHFGLGGFVSPAPCPQATCPFTMSIDSIDGGSVPAGREELYRCGSVHSSKLAKPVHFGMSLTCK